MTSPAVTALFPAIPSTSRSAVTSVTLGCAASPSASGASISGFSFVGPGSPAESDIGNRPNRWRHDEQGREDGHSIACSGGSRSP